MDLAFTLRNIFDEDARDPSSDNGLSSIVPLADTPLPGREFWGEIREGSDMWYFAYGANMCTRVLTERRGVKPLLSEAAKLNGYRLVFQQPGIPFIEPVFGDCSNDTEFFWC